MVVLDASSLLLFVLCMFLDIGVERLVPDDHSVAELAASLCISSAANDRSDTASV